jgi:hypothetical protein
LIENPREHFAALFGEWLPWLKAEFGWSQPTASRFVQVAEAFKLFSLNSLGVIEIEATALYMLAALSDEGPARDGPCFRSPGAQSGPTEEG